MGCTFRDVFAAVLMDPFSGFIEARNMDPAGLTVGELAAQEGRVTAMAADATLGEWIVLPDGTLALPWDSVAERSSLERAVEIAEEEQWTAALAWVRDRGFDLAEGGPECVDGREVWRLAPIILRWA